jgi:hypothetical protein
MKSWLVCGGATVTVGENLTTYIHLGTPLTNSTESSTEAAVRDALTMRNLKARLPSNAVTAASSLTLRKSLADSALTMAVASDTAGDFADTSNSVAFADTDEFSFKVATGDDPVSGSMGISGWSVELEPADSLLCLSLMQAAGPSSFNTASTVYYQALNGASTSVLTSEGPQQMAAGFAGTWRNGRVRVSSNGRAQATTWRSRKNGADGSQTITVAGSATGTFEDTSNSDTFAQGDLLNWSITTGTGSGTISSQSTGCTLVSTTGHWQFMAYNVATVAYPTAATRYTAVSGRVALGVTEADYQQAAPFAFSASRLSCVVSSNAANGATSVTFRKGTADTALTFTIASGATGTFSDTTNEVAIAAGDKVGIEVTNAGSSGSCSIQMFLLRGRTAFPRVQGHVIG